MFYGYKEFSCSFTLGRNKNLTQETREWDTVADFHRDAYVTPNRPTYDIPYLNGTDGLPKLDTFLTHRKLATATL